MGLNYINLKIIIITTIVGVLNSFFYQNFSVMLGLCAIELLVLAFYFIKGNYAKFMCFYLIFLCFSMESSNFVGEEDFYGFKNFRVAGVNIAVIALLPLIIKALLSFKLLIKKASSLHKDFLIKMAWFSFIGAVMGLVTYVVGDNGISNYPESFGKLFNCYYGWLLPYFEIIAVSYALLNNKNNLYEIKCFLFSSIFALVIIMLSCLIMGNYGNRSGLISLQIPEVSFLLACSLMLIVFPVFNKWNRVLVFLGGLIIITLCFLFNSSGKLIILAMFIPLILFIVLKRTAKRSTLVLTSSFIGVLTLIVGLVVFPLLLGESMLLSHKFEDVIGLFNFFGENWLENIPSSPQMRVTEFMNICDEYIRKPYFIFFGKGFMGTIQDNLNLFGDIDEAAFSVWELQIKTYYGVHESLNAFFLVGGFWGLYVFFSVVKNVYSKLHLSPWLVLGVLWFLLIYNYHMSVGIYGIVSFVVGLIDVADIENQKKIVLFNKKYSYEDTHN